MSYSPEVMPQNNAEKESPSHQTPEKLRNRVDSMMSLFVNEFNVEGKEQLVETQDENPDAHFVIASSHISNLDAPAAIKALGDRFNIQITAESLLFGMTPQEIMFRLGGKENFSAIEYRKSDGKKTGVFNPADFEKLSDQMNEGKTPWMAIHPFTVDDTMKESRIGSVYLAHKTGAKILPTALEIQGGSINLEGALELAKGIASKIRGDAKATFHIGETMDLPELDVSIIEEVLRKRAEKEPITPEEREKFKNTTKILREQADMVAQTIASLLPEEQRGVYAKSEHDSSS